MVAYLVSLAILAGIYAVFTLGLNIQWGYTGLFNIGIAGFFCIGAYASALITTPMPTGIYAQYVHQIFGWNLPFVFGILGAALVCGFIAFLIGIPTLRLREDYLAIATIGIAETIRLVFNNEQWLANGPRGLMGLPQPLQEWIDPKHYNYIYLVIVLLIMVIVYLLIERGIRSPWGRVLRAIREDEVSATMSGKDIFHFKMQSLIFGSMVMGIGGALYAHYTKAISPDVFTPLYGTFIIWVMLMVGGSGNNKGAILGAFVVWGIWTGTNFMTDLLPYTLKARAPYIRFLLIGILLEVILIYRPQGLLGEEKKISKMID
ncbi:MAG: branched-chain amino acid ABC transporter permease [Deltaproteobacteria bacterium CG_4_8_14_3_um_filter_45_9]|nr:MAG: branched-chain amino acid ABC transporter permease [Deltaproteobacteria bacterium CG03_land_8_20_14_0_80_45_14]PIX21162.1 MAG: branched-chain amino acid ABC transporter permease [Deltaproteobacteria bacterium CG_4_8_14_3_um_filter_45_9]